MKIIGLVWAGVRTSKHNEMAAFCREVLGLKSLRLESDFQAEVLMSIPGVEPFELPNGDVFEIVATGAVDLPDWTCPKVDFLVEDVAAARAEMEAKGVKFVRPIESTPQVGFVWTHFRAPDGHLYGLTSIEGHPGLNKQIFAVIAVSYYSVQSIKTSSEAGNSN